MSMEERYPLLHFLTQDEKLNEIKGRIERGTVTLVDAKELVAMLDKLAKIVEKKAVELLIDEAKNYYRPPMEGPFTMECKSAAWAKDAWRDKRRGIKSP
mgnify:CR=1 FL=1